MVLPFKLFRNGFTNLGDNITKDVLSLYQENFCLLKLDLKKWKPLYLSLAWRVNCIKLPKFLYLFQCITLYVPKSFLKYIDKALIAFIWDE